MSDNEEPKKPSLDTSALKARLGLKQRKKKQDVVGSEAAVEDARRRADEVTAEAGVAEESFGVLDDGKTPLPQPLPEAEVQGTIPFEEGQKAKWLPLALGILFIAGVAFLLGNMVGSALSRRGEVNSFIDEARTKLQLVHTDSTRSGAKKLFSVLELRARLDGFSEQLNREYGLVSKKLRPIEKQLRKIEKQLQGADAATKPTFEKQAKALKKEIKDKKKLWMSGLKEKTLARLEALLPILRIYVGEKPFFNAPALTVAGGSSQADLSAAAGQLALETASLHMKVAAALGRLMDAEIIVAGEAAVSKSRPKQLALGSVKEKVTRKTWWKTGLPSPQATAACAKQADKQTCSKCCDDHFAKDEKKNAYFGGISKKRGCTCVGEEKRDKCAQNTDCPTGYTCEASACVAQVARHELKMVVAKSGPPFFAGKGIWKQKIKIPGRKYESWNTRGIVNTDSIQTGFDAFRDFLAERHFETLKGVTLGLAKDAANVKWSAASKVLKKFGCAEGGETAVPAEADCDNKISNGWNVILDETRKCGSGDGRACLAQAKRYETGDGVAKNPAKAVALTVAGCVNGQFAACETAAARYFKGDGVELDKSRAQKLLKIACDGGRKSACGGK